MGDLASMQAVTRVNAEQASKRVMRKPTPLNLEEGRRRWEGESDGPSGSAGVVATACTHTGMERNTGSPPRWRVATSNRRPARDRPGRGGWRRGP